MTHVPRSSRRRFLQHSAGWAVLGTAVPPSSALTQVMQALTKDRADWTPEQVAADEDYWRPIQDSWHVDRSLLNLNNGGVSPPLQSGLDSFQRLSEFSYQAPAYHMWRTLEPQKEAVRETLARHFGAHREEIAIVRNASEALEIAIFGLTLAPGDEVLSTDQDYPRMVQAWEQRKRREGIEFRQIELPMGPAARRQDVLDAFANALTERTKVLHFCHVVNLTGQILPVRELCAMARARGIVTIVDGAHSFSHLVFRGDQLGCDYFGTSLHKWYSAPIGTGMLYVRRERIRETWPLFAASAASDSDIRKFEQFGTHSVPLFLAIAETSRFHDALGFERKSARMRYLRDLWARPLAKLPSIRFQTCLDTEESCGIATVAIDGVPASKLADHLHDQHRIFVTPIVHPSVNPRVDGIRVSPHLYTTPQEIERFVAAMTEVAQHGLPA